MNTQDYYEHLRAVQRDTVADVNKNKWRDGKHCPHCEEGLVSEKWEIDKFQICYEDIREKTLEVAVPVMTCDSCKESWTDYRGELIRHSVQMAYVKGFNDRAILAFI
jgi:hypothetical protein